MSQYPSPYSPPPQQHGGYDFNYYQPSEDLLTPARRASVMMFIMGGLLALGGLCCGAVGTLAPIEQMMSQNPTLSAAPGMTPDLLKMSAIVMGVLALLFGVALLILGYFVRDGGMVSVVLALVLVGMAVLGGALVILSGLTQLRGSGPEMLGLCMYVIPLVLLIVLLVMLIQAMKNAPRVAMAKHQYQQQYWQYQQQQQMYQAGYFPPPAPPPPSAPPEGANPPSAPSLQPMPPPIPPAPPLPRSSSTDDPSRDDPDLPPAPR